MKNLIIASIISALVSPHAFAQTKEWDDCYDPIFQSEFMRLQNSKKREYGFARDEKGNLKSLRLRDDASEKAREVCEDQKGLKAPAELKTEPEVLIIEKPKSDEE